MGYAPLISQWPFFSDVQVETPRRVVFPKTLRGVMFYKAYEKLRKDKDVPSWRYPPHIITLRHFANDTELSGLKIDWVNLRLECDWRAVFTHLILEEKLRRSLVRTLALKDPFRTFSRLRVEDVIPRSPQDQLPSPVATGSNPVQGVHGIEAPKTAHSRCEEVISSVTETEEGYPYRITKELIRYRRSAAPYGESLSEARKQRMMRHANESEQGISSAGDIEPKDDEKLRQLMSVRGTSQKRNAWR